ncbi:hypothetical protein V8G54_013205 [Vigna mungo]|uniref:Uncharacterized protein n=1 Tax=Vigna mungo TaxID=3915 RepID=A0AAQ3S1B3_VIGMU
MEAFCSHSVSRMHDRNDHIPSGLKPCATRSSSSIPICCVSRSPTLFSAHTILCFSSKPPPPPPLPPCPFFIFSPSLQITILQGYFRYYSNFKSERISKFTSGLAKHVPRTQTEDEKKNKARSCSFLLVFYFTISDERERVE